jgi:hypothetical protein
MDKERGLASYVAALSETLGHADRVGPLVTIGEWNLVTLSWNIKRLFALQSC